MNIYTWRYIPAFFWSGDSGQDFLNDTRGAQKLFGDSMDFQWQQYIGSGAHPIWLIMARAGMVIALATMFYFVYELFQKYDKNSFHPSDLKELIIPFIVVMFLSNNAALTGQLAIGMRGIGKNINYQLTQDFGAYVKVAKDYNNDNSNLTNDEVRKEMDKAAEACKDIYGQNPQYEECMISELEKNKAAAEAAGQTGLGTLIGNVIKSAVNKTYDLATYTASSVILADDRIKLFAAAVSFVMGADMALFITALYGPMAVATSLLPAGSKSFIAWVSAFWTINITTIAYTIMVSLLVSVIDSGRGIESYIFAQLIGWGLPTLAIAFGAGGGFTLYSSFIAIGVGASGGFSTSKMISAIKPSFGK
jgi:hypothetical protein